MHVLILGNMGYVGSVLTGHLRRVWPDARLSGFDSGLFAHCLTTAGQGATGRLPEAALDMQHFGDVRDVPAAVFAGVDAVVLLAAVSNDPMGRRFEAVTDAINRGASLRVAGHARAAGARSLVFASSCSVYGQGGDAPRTERDAVNPLTAYARSKVQTEAALAEAAPGDMAVTCLRFATACGMSPRLRLDLVLNDFVAAALTQGRVQVLSDGTPWRPLIDVADMARAIEWAIGRSPARGGAHLVVNAGHDRANIRVRPLAEAVVAALPGTALSVNAAAAPDPRSYRVDFSRFAALAPGHLPRMGLRDSIDGLIAGMRAIGVGPGRGTPDLVRLGVLDDHIAAGRLSPDLRWR